MLVVRRLREARSSVRHGSTFGRQVAGAAHDAGMSQVELARRIGRHQTAIGPYERDEYEPPRDVVEKLALVLETSPEYLYFGRSPLQISPAGGRAGSAALACSRPPHEATMELVQLRDEQLRGYRVRDDSMAPVFRPGQLALALAGGMAGPGALLGRDALVELADGGSLLRRLLPSSDAATASTSLPTMRRLLPMVAVQDGQVHCGCPVAGGLARAEPAAAWLKSVSLTVDEKF